MPEETSNRKTKPDKITSRMRRRTLVATISPHVSSICPLPLSFCAKNTHRPHIHSPLHPALAAGGPLRAGAVVVDDGRDGCATVMVSASPSSKLSGLAGAFTGVGAGSAAGGGGGRADFVVKTGAGGRGAVVGSAACDDVAWSAVEAALGTDLASVRDPDGGGGGGAGGREGGRAEEAAPTTSASPRPPPLASSPPGCLDDGGGELPRAPPRSTTTRSNDFEESGGERVRESCRCRCCCCCCCCCCWEEVTTAAAAAEEEEEEDGGAGMGGGACAGRSPV